MATQMTEAVFKQVCPQSDPPEWHDTEGALHHHQCLSHATSCLEALKYEGNIKRGRACCFCQVGVEIADSSGDIILRASHRQLVSPGYLAAYATSFFKSTAAMDEEEAMEGSGDAGIAALKVSVMLSAWLYKGCTA